MSATKEDHGEDGSGSLVFVPTVSEQRYTFALNLVKQHKARKVIDMGCGPCQLLRRIKWLECVEEVVGIDFDGDLLRRLSAVTKPVIADYVKPRKNGLKVSLMEGSIGEFDQRLQDFDMLLCVEVIEHLYDPVLVKVPEVVFGLMKPKRALFTTPNADFNVLFKMEDRQYRHPDHKFEWSRKEFKNWCTGISQMYGYAVEYVGMGQGPEDSHHLGSCTQGAVFTHPDQNIVEDNDSDIPLRKELMEDAGGDNVMPYTLIAESIFPASSESEISATVLLESEIRRHLLDMIQISDGSIEDYDDEDKLIYRIHVKHLCRLSEVKRLCSGDEEVLRKTIQSSSCFHLSNDCNFVICRDEDIECDRYSDENLSDSHGRGDHVNQVAPDGCAEWWSSRVTGKVNPTECWDDT